MKRSLFASFVFVIFIISGPANGQNTWIKRANYGGGPRSRACGFSIGSKGYILTGYNGGYFKDVWVYDTGTDTWSSKANFGGTARQGAAGLAIGGIGYVMAGHDVSSYLDDVWTYNPNTDSWAQKTSCPGGGRQYPVAVVDTITRIIYFGCGDNGGAAYLSDWWKYDPTLDKWTALSAFPGGQRSWPVGFYLNGYIYVGTGNDNSASLASGDWWKYDPTSDKWTQMVNVPVMRRSACSFIIGNYGFVCLGLNGNTSLNDVWEYDPTNDSWTTFTNYGGGRLNSPVAFTIGKHAFVGTGFDSTGSTSSVFYELNSSIATVTENLSNPDNKIGLYPNPSGGIINIICPDLKDMCGHIEIMDINGKKCGYTILKTALSKITIRLNNSSSGMYYCCIISQNGNTKYLKKFIVYR